MSRVHMLNVLIAWCLALDSAPIFCNDDPTQCVPEHVRHRFAGEKRYIYMRLYVHESSYHCVCVYVYVCLYIYIYINYNYRDLRITGQREVYEERVHYLSVMYIFLYLNFLLSMYLQLTLCGTSVLSLSDWRRNTTITPTLSQHPHVVEWFWTIVGEISPSQRMQLLVFVTSMATLPPGGFAHLQPRFTLEVRRQPMLFEWKDRIIRMLGAPPTSLSLFTHTSYIEMKRRILCLTHFLLHVRQ